MFMANDTTTNQWWVVDNGHAKVITNQPALKWSGPIRKSGSMRYLIAALGYKVVP